MNKCIGCGALLQDNDCNKEGYIKDINKELCNRCFRIRNYGEYEISNKTNADYIPILKEIDKTNDLVVLVLDLFNVQNIDNICEYLNNDILLVLTKRDVMPSSLYEEKLLNYFNHRNIIDKVIISSKKNYNFDELIYKINKYKKSKNAYIVGYTNSGKSTMINKLMKDYSNNESKITTSIMPSTTLNTIEIVLNENLNLIDTPGLLLNDSIYDKVNVQELKKIIPNKEIKPTIYQVKVPQTIIVDKYLRIDVNPHNDIVLFFSNNLNIDRKFKNTSFLMDEQKIELEVNDNHDIVINGLGFIKVKKKCKIIIYTLKDIKVFIRPSLI